MAYLLNRNPAARFECLHALSKLIFDKFGTNNTFSMKDVKYDRSDDVNIHSYCTLLVNSILGTRHCPYKQNPLDEAGCSLTNGVIEDTTKSKEVSNTINALHALDFVERDNSSITLTSSGVLFSKATFGTKEMQEIIKKAVLNYGPVIGVLKQIYDLSKPNNIFNSNDIKVGYPNTLEVISYNGYNVTLSSGSQKDSNTRTRSFILAWLTTAGFIRPLELEKLEENEFAHYKFRDYLNQSHRGERTYALIEKPCFIESENKFITNKPLDFKNLTKLTAALRENNQNTVREATLKYEPIINNRRFAILYFLNEAYLRNRLLKLEDLLSFFRSNYETFIITDDDLLSVIASELQIAYMAGIPYDIINEAGAIYIKPITGINLIEMSKGAPLELINILENTTI